MPHSVCLHHCRRRDPTGFCGGPLASIYSSADSSRSLRSSINYSHPLAPSHPSSFASRNLSFFCFPPLVFTRFSVPSSSMSLSQVLIALSLMPPLFPRPASPFLKNIHLIPLSSTPATPQPLHQSSAVSSSIII